MTPFEITLTVMSLGVMALAWRNPTYVALALSFLVPKALYLRYGYELGVQGQFYVDWAVIIVIYCKRGVRHPWCRRPDRPFRYRTAIHSACALWLERSPWDRFVLLCFPAAWWFYGLANTDVAWWGLIAIWLAQITAATWEGLEMLLIRRRAANAVAQPDSNGAEFAWATREGYG